MDDADLPVPAPEPQRPPAPQRRLTGAEVEQVIRRAVALQARDSEGAAAAVEGMTEAELVRMSGELGLTPRHIRQALAEVESAPAEGEGWFGRGLGEAVVRAERVLESDAAAVRAELDRYLRNRECMVVQRRLGDRLIYQQSPSLVSQFRRMATSVSASHPLLGVPQLEVTVSAIDERSTYVSLGVSRRSTRTALTAGGLLAGSGIGGFAAAAGAIAIAPPAALVGIPLFLGALFGSRAIYQQTNAKAQVQLESLLDRLEHREL
ncbi:MAG TPA: hypothetical protein VFX29_05935 [Longimicrobiaceae bacterium]|jgi:hypothetical protein|nr:hypothetical protein [Longimicrobiaceae bacterium]